MNYFGTATLFPLSFPAQPARLVAGFGQDCEVLVIVEDNTLVRNKDDVVIRREYSLVDVASCCEADLEIRNLHNDDEVPCEMTLHAR